MHTALENLNLAQRQVEPLKAQYLSGSRANKSPASLNLEGMRIVSPVDGFVTNLSAQIGDYVNVGKCHLACRCRFLLD